MIVASLLLILVAVMLLVVGLAGGSSTLLICSIAASLLAAVALVIGARQAAVVRRAAATRTDPGWTDPGGTEAGWTDAVRAGVPPTADPGAGSAWSDPVRTDPAGAPPVDPQDAREPAMAHASGGRRQNDPSAMLDDPPAPDEGLASPGAAQARVASPGDAESALAADAAYREREAAEAPVADTYDYVPQSPPSGGYDDSILTDDETYERERTARAAGDGDYDQASSYIGGARSENPGENAWRRQHSAEADDDLLRPAGRAGGASPAEASASSPAGDPRGPGGAGFFDRPGPAEEFGAGLAEEFGEPDEDDPDDEPLPQAVRPADAVRVARMDAEVLVVDGRPRYHLADCPHLVGRLTEPLPVAEAVELAFSPCGLCRPVDRLVAQAAHR
jgi:hypothetical protein